MIFYSHARNFQKLIDGKSFSTLRLSLLFSTKKNNHKLFPVLLFFSKARNIPQPLPSFDSHST